MDRSAGSAGREGWGGFKTGLDVGEGAPARGIGAQTFSRNGSEGLWNGLRYRRLPIGRSVPNRRVLGQGFDHGDAQRPDVRRRGERPGGSFRCVIDGWRWKLFARFARGMKAVRRKFHLIAGGHDVRWLDATVQETFPVEIGERAEDRVKHHSGLGGREWPFGENLGENLVAIFRHRVKQRSGVDLTAPGVKQAQQVRMGQGCRQRPVGDVGFRVAGISRNELDGGPLRSISPHFREEDATPFRAAQPLEERKSSVDDPSDPIAADCSCVHRVTILL